jgi:hypothetical protein
VRKKEIRCVLRWMDDIKLDLRKIGIKQWASVICGQTYRVIMLYEEVGYILTSHVYRNIKYRHSWFICLLIKPSLYVIWLTDKWYSIYRPLL